MEEPENFILPTTRTKQQMFDVFRANGYTQKDSGKFVGISEKTAGVYEEKRLAAVKNKIIDLDDLISRLKIRADNPKTVTSQLIKLTTKLQELYKEKEKLKYQLEF